MNNYFIGKNYTPITKSVKNKVDFPKKTKVIITGISLAGLIFILGLTVNTINKSTSKNLKAQLIDVCGQQGGVFIPDLNICPQGHQSIEISASAINQDENSQASSSDITNPPGICCKPIDEIQPTQPSNDIPIPTEQGPQPSRNDVSPTRSNTLPTPTRINTQPSNTPKPPDLTPDIPDDQLTPGDDKDAPSGCVVPDLAMPGFVCDDPDCLIEILDYP